MQRTTTGPKRRRHFSFNEGVDETDETMKLEPTDVQSEGLADENEPVERVDEMPPAPPAFEEEQ